MKIKELENIGIFFKKSTCFSYWLERLLLICHEYSTQNLEYCSDIIAYYMEQYYKAVGEIHPYINSDGVKYIVNELLRPDSLLIDDLTSGDYAELINQHFKTHYKNCDYSIFHFLSGEIRNLRFYEVLY